MNRNVAILLVEILGILAIVLIGQRFVTIPTPPGSAVPATRLAITNVSAQLDLFRVHCGRYPTAEEGLTALLVRPDDGNVASKWLGPYVKAAAKDGWGRDLNYAVSGAGASFRIWSSGPDGLSGTADDVEVSKPSP